MKGEQTLRRLGDFWKKYQPVFLVLALGLLLLLWPTGEQEETADASAGEGTWFDLEQTEEKFARALSEIEGAGEVTVVLTVKEGPRRVLAQDGRAEKSGSGSTRETSTVLVSQGSGREMTMDLQTVGPTYQGALVVAQGAGDPQIRLALNQAVAALTGLRSDEITIWKGK